MSFEGSRAKAIATPEQVAKVQDLIDNIYREEYFVMVWNGVKHENPLTGMTVEELLKPFQYFWSALPDSPSIRRFPFGYVCDLAEDYSFGLIHDEPECEPVHGVDSPEDDEPTSCYHC